MLWHEQRWDAIESLDKSIPVVIPLGSIEQHGRHLPLSVDTVQVTAIAERAERLLGSQALFLPTLWLGCSEHHRDFPGTISLPPTLYSEAIKSVAESILRAGFNRLFFLNGHGGNEIPAWQALTSMTGASDDADAAHLVFASWWQVARDAITPESHNMSSAAITHACEYETSLMLALRPDLVDLPRASEGGPVFRSKWYDAEYGGKVRLFHRFSRLTSSGSMGQPRDATAEKGQSLIDAITADVVAFVREFASWPLFERRR